MFSFDSILENTQQSFNKAIAQDVTPAIQPIVESNTTPIIEPAQAIPSAISKNYKGEESELFTVESHDLSGPYGTLPNKKGLFVDQDLVNIVSNRYEIHQPKEIYQNFQNVAASKGLEINRVLTNKNKGSILISANYADMKIAGEDHKVNFVFYTSHCGQYKTVLSCDLLRIACFNQIPTIMANKKRHIFSEKHYQNALSNDTIEKCLENIPSLVETYQEKANLLKETKLSLDDFIELWADYYKQDRQAKRFDSKVQEVRDTYMLASGQRELSESAYKAFQACTFMNTHNARNTGNKLETVQHKNMDDSSKLLEYIIEEVAA